MKEVSIAIVGAGSRGAAYARFALANPDKAKVVAVAEPRNSYRESLVKDHSIPAENVFADWRDLAEQDRLADLVVIATQDNMHTEPAVEFAKKKYHILLEKPMAPTENECKQIVDAVEQNGVLFGVCHVLRYTQYTKKLKEIIDSGAIGEIVNVQHLEPVGYWHQAHSFVRGNWKNENESTFMLMAKSCHDMDWLRYIVGKRCKSVSSFGNLHHFRKENMPAGAAERCIDCAVESECPYSAKKIYLDAVQKGKTDWPLDVLSSDPTVETIENAIEYGPYGKCVYCCDNDVVDHQVVNLLFENGSTASFTMTAFSYEVDRVTRIFGTKGQLIGDSSKIIHHDYLTRSTEEICTNDLVDSSILTGHGGGDFGIMESFVKAVEDGQQGEIVSGHKESLESHLIVFAAEKARKENKVIHIFE